MAYTVRNFKIKLGRLLVHVRIFLGIRMSSEQNIRSMKARFDKLPPDAKAALLKHLREMK